MNILLRTLATLTLLALTSFSTTAATRTWTGDAISNDHWTDKDNWAGDNQPVSGDILVFPLGIQNTDKGMFNTFGSGTSFQRLDFRDDGYTISGSPVRLAGGITIIIPDGDVRFDVPVKLVGNQAFQCVKTGSAGFQVGIELRPGATGAALELGSHTLTVTGTQGFVAAEGEITGTGCLTIGDGGRMLLERANSYTGLTVIRPGGKLELFHSDLDPITSSLPTLGTTDSPTHVHGTLHLFSDRDLEVAEPLKLFDGSLVEFTQDAFSAGQIDLTGPIELMGPGTMTVGRVFAPEPIVYGINGRISGSGDLVIPASDFQIAIGGSQANTFSGSFHARVRKTYLAKPAGVTALSCASVFIDPDVNHPATLQLNASHQIADTAEVNILEGGTLDLQTRAETIRALTIEGGTVEGSGSARLDVLQNISAPGANVVGTVNPELRLHADPCVLDVGDGDTADDLVFNGLVSREPGASLRKTGAGRVVFKELQAMPVELLGGVSVFAQATGVGITLNGGTLAGRGIVGVINSAAGGGRVEPGLSTGILTNGGVTWNSNTTFAVEILNTTPGTGHDQLKVLLAGVNLGGARLEVTTLPGFGAAIGQEMVIIDNDGSDSVIGGFNGLTNGAEVATASGVRFTVHYDGGTGNDVTLRTTFIPPSLVTRSWDGGDAATDNTTARDNWQPNVLPTPGDALLFPNVAKKTVQNGITAFTPFNALTFAAPGYVVNGLPIALLNGLTNTAASGTNVFNLPVRLLQDATFSSTADGKLIIGTTPVEMVNLNGHRLTLHAATTNGLVVFGQEAPLITPQDGIFGAGSVAKTGPGLATIITFNDYTGPTLVQSGTLEVQNGDALGEIGPGNGTTVAAGAALLINPLGSFGAPIREDILLDGTLRQKDDGAAVGPPLLGTLSLNLPDRLVDVPAAPLQYFGAITGPGGLRKIGAGELKLGGTNTNTFSARLLVEAGRVTLSKPSGVPAVGGPVEVTGGLLRATSNTQFGATSTLTVRFPGSADFSDTQQRFDTGIFLQGAAISNVAPLIVGGNLSTIAAATPSILEGSAAISGTSQWTVTDGAVNPDLIVHSQIFDSLGGTLRKTGSGSVVFTGPNLLGLVQIDAGIALFHGSNTTSIQLNGGTLGGTGRVATVTSLANGGVVAPGAGTGILTAGNVAWNSATVFAPEVRTAIAGTGYDQLRVFGTVNLGGAALDVTVLSNFTATPTDTLVIIDNDGADAVVGTFAGLTNGASFTEVELGTGTPRTFRIAYNGGAGSNDVTLQLLAIGTVVERGGLELAKTSSNAIPGSVVLGGPTPPGANMVLLGSNQIADAANVVLADSSILLLNSFSDQIGGLLLESASVAGASNALLILNGGLQSAGANPSVLNTPVRVTGGPRLWSIARTAGADHLEARQPISAGPGASIIKTGAGRLRCFATNSVPLMLLEAGGAVFDAANPLTAILLNGGELAGDGTVSHVTSIVGGGAVVPGLSVGVLTASNVTWNAATSFRCELDPGQSDRLTALGPVNLGSATLELALPFTAPLNYSVAILLNESGAPITGTFAGLPEGALFAVEGQVFQITYHGTNADDTDGDDVQLTRVSTPPSFLSGITILPNGLTQFSGSGVPGAIYTIEASEDLLQWSAVGTVTAESNSLYQFLDVDSLTFPHRFYRAISP